jgi:tricorn protease
MIHQYPKEAQGKIVFCNHLFSDTNLKLCPIKKTIIGGGKMKVFRIVTLVLAVSLTAFSVAQTEECRLMRFPDIHKDKIVFVYAGDLWLVSSQGGVTRKLTSHNGQELFPKFSPDGQFIAFTGEYDGNRDVYMIPAEGGEPVRLTYHPNADNVVEWYPDGERILFRSTRTSDLQRFNKLFSIPIEGGFPEELPLPEGELTSFSSDAKRIAYNRKSREFRTWKRYQGGMAQDIWIYGFDANTIEQITDWKGTDNFPMWSRDKIYFTSDREHTLNIYCYDLNTKNTRKITNHKEYDVKWPSLGPNAIIYENGGYLYVLDLTTEKTRKIPVEVPCDRILTRPSYEKVAKFVRTFSLSPSASRALFGARGDIFTVPKEKGDIRNITQTPVIREISPTWSPDGKWIAYFSDRTGEYELYIRPQDGTGDEIQITTDGDCYRFQPIWSPDSKKLLYSDKKLRLFYVDIDEKKPVEIDKSDVTDIRSYVWSPDNKWVAYVKHASNDFGSIYLYSLDQKKKFQITDDFNDDRNPAFDPDGKYLFFLSSRSFNPTFSDFESAYIYRNSRNIYVVTLQADSLSPFAPESDEEKGEKEKEEKDKGDKDKKEEKKAKPKKIKIDLTGIDQRIVGVPIKPGNYAGLKAVKDKLFYLAMPAIPVREEPIEPQNDLHMYDMKERKDHTLLTNINGYDISKEGDKAIYHSKDTYGIIETKQGEHKIGDGKLNTTNMQMKVDPRGEWRQMFDEAWRLERDFFYDPNMHGVDWDLMKERYGQLLPYVAHRADLNYILGEMIGELCCSHTYVGGGQMPKTDQVGVGLMGADLEPDKSSGFYQFKKIYQGQNWDKKRRAPLTEPGVVVKEGEYLIAVNDEVVRYPDNLFRYFENTVDKQTKIKVNDKPTAKGARELTIKPIGSDNTLRYIDWVETNRRKVEEATNGRVGYIHVPNTSISGLNEFSRAFFPQVRKEGLIIDVRYNSGGMVPDMFLEHLRRKLVSMWVPREGQDWLTPSAALHGHMVCIINASAGSGGDAFPYYFREYNLGPLIGTRTWGGLVGIARWLPLMDGGYVTCSEFAFRNLKGEWDVENYGVDPDIEVDNRPDLVMAGHDPQLEKAIEVILKKIEESPKKLPKRPPFPVKK